MPLLAIVIPVYNEAPVLPELLRRLAAVCDRLDDLRCQVIFVDDGSRDDSAAILREAARRDSRLRLVRLSRNFGHQPALTAGLHAAAEADAVVTMDADLQDPPELIPALVSSWRQGAEVVLAVRTARAEHGLRRLGFEVFHRCFARVSDLPVESNTGTYGLLARPAIEAFNALGERHRFFPGMRAWVGFTRAEVTYERQERAAGTPGQTMRRLVRYALDGIFSFSRLPLRLVTYAGLFVAGCGFVIAAFFTARRLLGIEVAATGFTTLVTLVLFLGGVQLVGIGILGEYLGRIYDEVKRRPIYVTRPDEG